MFLSKPSLELFGVGTPSWEGWTQPFKPQRVWQIPQVSRNTGGVLRGTQGDSISPAYAIRLTSRWKSRVGKSLVRASEHTTSDTGYVTTTHVKTNVNFAATIQHTGACMQNYKIRHCDINKHYEGNSLLLHQIIHVKRWHFFNKNFF